MPALSRSCIGSSGKLWEKVITTLSYSLLSCTLSVVNKYILDVFPYPVFLLAIQLTSNATALYTGCLVCCVRLDRITRDRVIGFLPLVLGFFFLLASSLLLMDNAPFHTFLICKSLTPFFMGLSEALTFGTPYPTPQSLLAVVGMALGSVMYASYDEKSSATGLLYAVLFICCTLFEGLIARRTIQKFDLNQVTRTFLLNALACPLAITWALVRDKKAVSGIQPSSVLPLCMACFLGLGMSISTMHMRTMFSATCVSVVAVCNKFLSLGFANLVLDGSLTRQSTLSTAFVLLCGFFYNENSSTATHICTKARVSIYLTLAAAFVLVNVLKVHRNFIIYSQISNPVHKSCQTAADNCKGPFLWDAFEHREGFGSNLNRRLSSLQLARILQATWIPSQFINSHDNSDIAAFLGLGSPHCNFVTIQEQVRSGSLFVKNISELLNTTSSGLETLNCSIYKALAVSFNQQMYSDHVFKYDPADRLENDSLRDHLDSCEINTSGQQLQGHVSRYASSRLPVVVVDSYRCARNRRLAASGRLKKSDEYRISLYFRWGDVRGELSDVSTYNIRTGRVPLSVLTQYTEEIASYAHKFRKSDIHHENQTILFFSEGPKGNEDNKTEFMTHFSERLHKTVIFQIGGSWMDAVDYMTQSNIILIGNPKEAFMKAIVDLCDDCTLIDVGYVQEIFKQKRRLRR